MNLHSCKFHIFQFFFGIITINTFTHSNIQTFLFKLCFCIREVNHTCTHAHTLKKNSSLFEFINGIDAEKKILFLSG